MAPKTTMFFLGGTGFIGGAVLEKYLKNPDYELAVFTRDAEKADKLATQFGIRTVVGDMHIVPGKNDQDLDVLTEEAAKADVVLQISIIWAFSAIEAVLKGMKKRFEATGRKPIFIYTSGGGAIVDDLNQWGNAAEDVVRTDTDTEYLINLSNKHVHYQGDTMVRLADEQDGYIRSYIIMPSTVWGIQKGDLAEAGITHRHSQPMPELIEAGKTRKQGGVIGNGLNRWSHVEVHEQAELYRLVIENALKNPDFPSGREGVYFGENGDYTMVDACKEISKALSENNIGSADPSVFSKDDLEKIGFLAQYIGASSLCRADRGRALGWNPVHGTDAFLASLKPEVEALL